MYELELIRAVQSLDENTKAMTRVLKDVSDLLSYLVNPVMLYDSVNGPFPPGLEQAKTNGDGDAPTDSHED